MKKILAIALIFLSTNAVAQWKSYYPEGIKNKKQKKQENKTDQQIKFNTHFYNALSLKTLETFALLPLIASLNKFNLLIFSFGFNFGLSAISSAALANL